MVFAYRWKGTTPRSGALNAVSAAVPSLRGCSAILLGASALLITALLGTEFWYRLHESESPGLRKWSLHPLGAERGASRVVIPPQTMRMLF